MEIFGLFSHMLGIGGNKEEYRLGGGAYIRELTQKR